MTQIEFLSAVFSGGGTAKIARSHVGRVGSLSNHRSVVWPRKFESVVRNGLVRCHDAAAMFCGHSARGQIIGQNEKYRTSAYPHLLRKFSDGDTTVLHDEVYWNERRCPPTCGHL